MGLFIVARQSLRRAPRLLTSIVRVRLTHRSGWAAPVVAILLAVTAIPAKAQEVSEVSVLEIGRIEFHGNETIDDDRLRDAIESRETPGGLSKWFYRTFKEKIGSAPAYFDPTTFEHDLDRLRTFYEDQGFYSVEVSGESQPHEERRRIDLVFTVREGKRSYIDSVVYRGLDSLPPDVRGIILRDPLVRKGMPYERTRAASEVRRILDALTDNGHPAAQFDDENSAAEQYLSTNNFVLVMAFKPGKAYTFDGVNLKVEPPRDDITHSLVLHHLDFEEGDTYSRTKIRTSEAGLNRLGLFETARFENPGIGVPDTAFPGNAVPLSLLLRLRPRNELAPELVVSDEGNVFNLGAGIGYTARNVFGGARIGTGRTRVRTQNIIGWNFGELFGGRGFRDPSIRGAAEVQAQFIQPYLFIRTLNLSLAAALSVEKQQPEYSLTILKSKLSLSNQFTQTTYGFLDWTIERTRPTILVDRPDSVAGILREEDREQLNSIITLTVQHDKTNDILSPTAGYFQSVSLEESGILPRLVNAGPTTFTQYYKITAMRRWYRDLSRTGFNIFAAKLRTGYQDKYGQSASLPVNIPLNRRFFGGGSGSVRGWKARDLGAMPDSLLPFGGNFMLEGSVELRIQHFRGFGKIWSLDLDNVRGVYFMDIGNVWSSINDFALRDVAVAAGFGFRYETFFGPFRVDYGFRLYDPRAPAGHQTVFQKKFFGETLGRGVFHFGIGQAF
jgi:outer membrane protein insertion porin family